MEFRTLRALMDGWRGKLLLAAASLCLAGVLAFAAAEILVRATRSYYTPATLRQASLEYEATLFARHAFPQRIQRKQDDPRSWQINEHGYRGPAFAVPKPDGVVRVIVLGGSAAFDRDAAEGEDWPRLLEERLRAAGRSDVEVINAGIPGHATVDVLGRLYTEIWMFEPDYVVIYNAWNDIKYFPWLTAERSLLRGLEPPHTIVRQRGEVVDNPYIYYRGFLDRMLSRSQLYVRLRTRYWQKVLEDTGPEGRRRLTERSAEAQRKDGYEAWGPRQYELNLRLIADAARNIGATPIFLTQARLVAASNGEEDRERIRHDYTGLTHEALVRAFADCDRAIRRTARAKNAPFLDLSAKLSGRPELFADHVHTSPEGSKAIAREVSLSLAEVIASDEAGRTLPTE